MARYVGPKCRLCRREGEKLFLKGSRCFSEKCPIQKGNPVPGQHGASRRQRFSDYGRHLREKQKVKRIYGVLEAPFRKYFENAAKVKGVTGQVLLQSLERRLDNVLRRSFLALSISHGRQLVRQGKVTVNEKVVNIPSYQVSKGDVIKVSGVKSRPQENEKLPVWLTWDSAGNCIKILGLPERADIGQEINEQLIVEFYSR